jgi:hypothetical protein
MRFDLVTTEYGHDWLTMQHWPFRNLIGQKNLNSKYFVLNNCDE